MSLADELTLMMIADEDERGRKQLEIQKKNDLASIEASEFSAEQKGKLKAKIEDKYNQLELTRQQAYNEKLKKAEEDYQRFVEEQGLQSEEAAKAAEDRKYSAYLELWQLRQENELLGIKNEKDRKLRELKIQEENDIAKVEGTEYSEQIINEIKKKYEAKRVEIEKDTQESIAKTQEAFNQIAGAVTSVTGPAFAAINALYDANLQKLENEKNQRLANENLTAEERLKIEEEYEKKKNEMMAEQFEVNRVSQIIQATMSAAQAALNAFTSTALLFAPAAPAAAAAAAAFGALQIGIIAAQPNPYKFYEGTPYLQLGDNPKGRDTIPVMAHEGEAIIPTRNNLQYPGLAQSWIDGNLDRYINNNFVRPALMEQQRQAEEDFADRLAASMALQMAANFDDYRLHRDLKEQTAVLRDGFHSMKITRKKLRGA